LNETNVYHTLHASWLNVILELTKKKKNYISTNKSESTT